MLGSGEKKATQRNYFVVVVVEEPFTFLAERTADPIAIRETVPPTTAPEAAYTAAWDDAIES
jgi:hypothetical protein